MRRWGPYTPDGVLAPLAVVYHLEIKGSPNPWRFWWTVRVDLFPVPEVDPLKATYSSAAGLGLVGLGPLPPAIRDPSELQALGNWGIPYGMRMAFSRGLHLPGMAESLLLSLEGV